jgi:hypothetical protein
MADPVEFIVEAGPTRPKRVVLNGTDVTGSVAGVLLRSQDGEVTRLNVLERPGAEGSITGLGIVAVDTPGGDDVGAFLASIVPSELDRLVAEWIDAHEDWDGSFASVVLAVLIERTRPSS